MAEGEGGRSFSVAWEPVGRRVRAGKGGSLLDAARAAGVEVVAVCGGAGSCGKCRVQVMEGEVSPPTSAEKQHFSAEALAAGHRLACQVRPRGDVRLYVPAESLTTPQRLQVEGEENEVPLALLVEPVDVTVDPPTLHDLRADTVRLVDALRDAGREPPAFGHAVLTELSPRLREEDWQVRVVLRRGLPRGEVVALLSEGAPLLGLAVDVGTTKVAAYLVELAGGRTLAKKGVMNPQVAYGEDIVSRIAYANDHPDGRRLLQEDLVEALNRAVADLCGEVGATPDQVVEVVVVGNTAIHHFFAGLPVRQLGEAPYLAAVSEALELPAASLGLKVAPGAKIYLPPNIAGYVGADHVSMLLATEAWRASGPTVALDIGTNTEITLAYDGRLLSCSCASGPAFEGAHIHEGMRAAPGAIEAVQIAGDEVRLGTIEGRPPLGLCGSGILDAVAQMRSVGAVAPSGQLRMGHSRVLRAGEQDAFLLVPAERTGHGRDLLVTRRDVNEIQLAKGAIRAGVEVLLREAGLTHEELASFVVAGAFGTYLDLESAVRVGMFPPLPLDRFSQVGNAAGTGARQMLVSAARRELASRIAEEVEYVELTTHPAFTEIYVEALVL